MKVTVNIQAQAGAGTQWSKGEVSYTQEVGSVMPLGEEKPVGTIPTLIDLGEALPTGVLPNLMTIVNVDTVFGAIVTVDNTITMDNFPQNIPPGCAIAWMPQLLPLYVVSDYPCSIWVAVS